MRRAAAQAGLVLEIDSAATSSYHIGKVPDLRAFAAAERHGLDISGCRSRQIGPDDFLRFTHIFAADRGVLKSVRQVVPHGSIAEIALMLDCVAGRAGQSVADPYFAKESAFDKTVADVTAIADALVKRFNR
ncbi:MAG: low molecular weight phosphotyrosine protein phosphatase [Candidatus Andeanibacterium colombiense]|uniref:protein-tyrosine-phosphatase n=1 Tax=Candidatus Andeanibacterium colombiense TaxID=3121345 RepID=A0AAJ5X9C6_9SPHN|nr:MAG: low molecular weight phosphotyrosine protein phosphatase [Sphingomonadaceae bacterium]